MKGICIHADNFLKTTHKLGTVQNLLHNRAGANAFLKFKKGSTPPKKTGKNVDTPQSLSTKW